MRITKFFNLFTVSLLMTVNAYSQSSLIKWNGYIQTRFASDFDKSTEFTIKQAKFWVNGTVPKVNYVRYKFQIVYRSFADEAFMVQDAYTDLQLKSYGSLRIGRLVPDFMLQRTQPDYDMPVMDRATVVNSLTHNEKQMARVTGIQYMFQHDSIPVHFSVGIFNGNVDKPVHSKDNSLLCSSRFTYKILNYKKGWLNIGSSVAYRYLNETTLTTICKSDTLISGNDFRWGVETQLHWNKFELQSEYIQADINRDKAKGWYTLMNYTFLSKYQIVALTGKYNSLNPVVNCNPWYGLEFNYQIFGRTRAMAQLKTQRSGNAQNYWGGIQLQVFFN